jgi:uncharacterized membrane protein
MRYGRPIWAPLRAMPLLAAGVVAGTERRALVAPSGESNAHAAVLEAAVAVGTVDLAAIARPADADLATAGGAKEEAVGVARKGG